MERTTIKTAGMSCGGCVKSVSGRLASVPGVISAEVSLEQAQSVIEFDPALVTREQLAAVIEAAGFETE